LWANIIVYKLRKATLHFVHKSNSKINRK
jgi:hypothetical protein